MPEDKLLKVDVRTAARILKISEDAIRKRVQRGSIEGSRDKNGKWTVTIPDTRPEIDQTTAEVVQILKKQVEFLEKELERKDHILLALTQKIPMLEAPKEPERRSWINKMFNRQVE